MNEIILLGTGTSQITLERRASSVLIGLDDTKILFDCGHGVLQRLLEIGVHPNDINHIILSHFHPDHVSDLIPFFHTGAKAKYNPRTTDLHVYGPVGVRSFIDKVENLFKPYTFRLPSYDIIVHEIGEEDFRIGPYSFDFVSLPHEGNHGLRFTWKGRSFAITGDSYFHDQEIDFLRNVDLAIIDAGHLEEDKIVELSVASQAKFIICSHIYGDIDRSRLQALARANGYQGTIVVGRDLLSLNADTLQVYDLAPS
jgi:ribonuclease BN (tRNA processing enzyme)